MSADILGPNLGRGHLGRGNDDDSIHIAHGDQTLCGALLADVANATARPFLLDGGAGCWMCLSNYNADLRA